jgi:transposase-like protein
MRERWSRPPRRGGGSAYDPGVAAQVLARMRAGKSVRSICRDRSLPSADTVYRWARSRPEFGDAFAAARAEVLAGRREDRAWAMGQAKRAQAWRNRGRKGRRPGPKGLYSEQLALKVCLALLKGASLAQVCARPGMPSAALVYKWRRERPDFARDYRMAREMAADFLMDQAFEIGMGCPPGEEQAARLKMRTLAWKVGRISARA